MGFRAKNNGHNYISSLSERFWPGVKSGNEVISMLQHISKLKSENVGEFPKKLRINTDNCSGQNRNRLLIWFCSLLVCTKQFDEVKMCFLIVGRTKNICDGSFGLGKRRLRRTNVFFPESVSRLINESGESSFSISGADVSWTNWKDFLRNKFFLPK